MATSAEIAFYEFVAIVPLIIFAVSLLGMVSREELLAVGLEQLGRMAPASVVQLLGDWIRAVRATAGASLLSAGALAALWSGSAGVGALGKALSRVYRAGAKRGFFASAAVRILFTFMGAAGLAAALALLVAAPVAVSAAQRILGVERAWGWAADAIRFPLAFLVLVALFTAAYRILPASPFSTRAHLSGAVLGAILFIIVSWLFSLYVTHAAGLDATFGSLGAILALLLWLQAANLSVLVGAAWNVERPGAGNRRVPSDGE